MNSIKKILDINNRELAANTPDAASWHSDYADTSYVYIGNLDRTLKEADVLTIFSQYGNPTHINLVRDKETGKSRGFCYLKYEDQRSCVLAVDNFNGTLIYERPLKVDHIYYKLAKGQQEDDFKVEYPEVKEEKQKQIEDVPNLLESKSVKVSSGIMDDDDFEDPMANMVMAKPERRHRSEREKSQRHKDGEKHRRERRRSRKERDRSEKSEGGDRESKRHRSDRKEDKESES